jgi:hypothetical protein
VGKNPEISQIFEYPVLRSGRWTDSHKPARYGEGLAAKRFGMAQLAALQGRAPTAISS